MNTINKLSALLALVSLSGYVSAQTSPLCGDIGEISPEIIEVNGQYPIVCELNTNTPIADGDTLRAAYYGIDVVWTIRGIVKVGNGDQALSAGQTPTTVALYVEKGVQFRSLDASALVVTRGSEIHIEGTAAEPVVMASKDNNFTGIGEWGGLVLQGYGIVNDCGTTGSVCNVEAEGVSTAGNISYFGGFDNNDSSGSITYLEIYESGFDVAGSLDAERSGNEINALTLVGVGANTILENITIKNGLDDGIEFFGGAAEVDTISIYCISDDSIDYDLGWSGSIDNAYVEQCDNVGFDGSGTAIVLADHVVEASGNPNDFDALPFSEPTITNFSFVSTGTDEALKFKEGAAGHISVTSATINVDQLGGNKGCLEIIDLETQDRISSGHLTVSAPTAPNCVIP
ncbi:hypothetical protein [Teredinibacter turnerae]|uniref:hypothetical protein n=1 Tax=Teredinibacter turnerae TaxID=2426 RepID=UPI0003772A62|nr:hypothetical protein [Teredinibacter turnerae]